MLAVVVGAVVMLVAGSTVLRDILEPHEHATRYILFWLGCAWLTVTALLLALFDALAIRAENRAAKKSLERRFTARDVVDDE